MGTRSARRKNQSSRTSAWLRGKGRLRVAAAVAATGLLPLAATNAAQAATVTPAVPGPLWNLAYQTHGGPNQVFGSITAPTKTDAWAVGNTSSGGVPTGSVFAHWGGHSWTAASIKGSGGFLAGSVYSSSPSNVWIFGTAKKTGDEEALVYNGRTWSSRALPPVLDSNFIALLGPSDVWADTSESCPQSATQTCTFLIHWNGARWLTVKIAGDLYGVTTAATHAWFFTLADRTNPGDPSSAGTPVLYEAAGSKIARVKAPSVRLTSGTGIVAAPSGQLWMLATLASKGHREALFHWNGAAWKGAVVPAFLCPPYAYGYCPLYLSSTLSYDGKGGFWSGYYAHWTGKQWLNEDFNVGTKLSDTGWGDQGVTVAIPGTHSVWGVGYIDRIPNSASTNGLVAVYGPLP